MSSIRACWLSFLFVAFAATSGTAQTVLYVDDSAPVDGDGLSWVTAYEHLQDALLAAVDSEGQVTEIRVAQGTYRPDEGQNQVPGSRTATFQLLEGVCIKGGFAGLSAPGSDSRDLQNYETVLDGANVSYHVVTGSGADGTAILDGVAIQRGNANGASGNLKRGGGILNVDGSPKILNCFIRSNYAADRGGGVYNEDYSDPDFVNCLIAGNHAADGAAMYNYLVSYPLLVNCAVAGNTATQKVGGIWSTQSSVPTVYNCILWYNQDVTGFQYEMCQIATDGVQFVAHSYVQGLTSSMLHPGNIGGDLGMDPGFVEPFGVDGMMGTADDDLRLTPSSPCVDRGDNLSLPADDSDLDGDGDTYETIPFDRGGEARAFNCIVDMGAYEAVTDLPTPIRTDFDGDCDVDGEDLEQFEACDTGPAMPYTNPDCEFADLDTDTDVDQTDFALFQGCFSGAGWLADPDCLPPSAPTVVDYSNSGCIGQTFGIENATYCDQDFIELFPSAGAVRIIHRNAAYNCCLQDIQVGFDESNGHIWLDEREILITPCLCMCCYDVETVVSGLQRGTYTVTVHGQNHEGRPTSHTMEVEIP